MAKPTWLWIWFTNNWLRMVVAGCRHHLYICIYSFFIWLTHSSTKIYILINVKIFPVGCLSETVQLSVLFANSLLHVYSAQSFSFKIKNTIRIVYWYKQHWKHSICDKSLFNFDILKLFFLSFLSCRPFRNWQTSNSLFSSVHHSLSRKTLDTIIKLYFCRNSLNFH